MIRFLLSAILLSFIFLGTYLYFHLGLYQNVSVREEHRTEAWLIYKSFEGPYHGVAPILDEVEKKVTELGLNCQRTFGWYLDDPASKDPDRLQSRLGCYLDPPTETQRQKVEPQLVAQKLETQMLSAKTYVVAEFDGAPSMGPLKVYPKLKDYFESHRWRFPEDVIEVYQFLSENKYQTQYLVLKPGQ